jgi:hypothetical protein
MSKAIVACVLAFGLFAVGLPANPAASQTPSATTAAPKALTPQRQKMKDCATKWKDEKASTGVKGRAAYNKFMRACLKKPAT